MNLTPREQPSPRQCSFTDIMFEPGRPRPSGTWLDTDDKLATIERQRSEYYVDFMCAFRIRQIHSRDYR